jgi:CBS domain containing-hemolysin-like protein
MRSSNHCRQPEMPGENGKPPPHPKRRRWPFAWHRSTGNQESVRRAQRPNPGADEQERLIIERLADLRDMEVREVMTPRVDVVALTIPVTAEAVIDAVAESGHSCFPVVGDDLDDLVGVLFVNDLFRAAPRRHPGELTERSPLDISRRIRQPYVVPETRRVLDVLAEMRQQHRAFAVVVDEYGGIAGVLTVKDLIEPLVGELQDEFDAHDEPEIVRVDRNRWLIDGRTSIDEVRERIGLGLPQGEYVTIGGFLFDHFDHIPAEGERANVDGWELRVVELDKHRIAKVLAKSQELDPDETEGASLGREPQTPASGEPERLR